MGQIPRELSSSISTLSDDTASIRQEIVKVTSWSLQYPDSALSVWNDLYQRSLVRQYDYGCIATLIGKANTLLQQRRYSEAIAFMKQSLQHCNEQKHPEMLATIYNNLGGAYSYLSQHETAARYYLAALNFKRKYPGSRISLGSIYINLGAIFLDLGETEKSFDFFNKAYLAAEAGNDKGLMVNSLHNRGGYYFQKGNREESERSYRQAIAIAETFENRSQLFRAYVGLGNLYKAVMEHDSALTYLLKAYRIYQEGNIEKRGYNMLLCFIGEVYKSKGVYSKAQQFYQYVSDDQNKTPAEAAYLYAKLAELYSSLGRFENAYDYRTKYHYLNDSLKTAEIAVKIGDLESRYELVQKNKELYQSKALLTAQKLKTQRRDTWLWVISSSSLLILAFGLLWFKSKQKRHKAEKYILSLKAKIEGEEQEKARIAHDLHDGVNSQLTAVKSFLISTQNQYPTLNKVQEFNMAKSLVSETAVEVRNIAHNLAPDNLLRTGLIPVVATFCEKLFTPAGIKHHVDSIGDFNATAPDLALTIYRIIQELCNNIVKHSRADHATIILTIIDNQLNLIVEDNGIGISGMETQKWNGIGIKGIRERVALSEGLMQVESVPGSHTTFNISWRV